MAAQPKASAGKKGGKGARRARWRRRLWVALPLLAVLWAVSSHWFVRPRIERALALHLRGEASVRFAVVWPTLNVTAFGVEVRGDGFTLDASRVAADLNPWALFGADLVEGVVVAGLRAELVAGERVEILRGEADAGERTEEAAGSGERDLDPMRVPPLRFDGAAVYLREPGDDPAVRAVAFDRLDVVQRAPRAFRIAATSGALGEVPVTSFSARVLPRAGRVLLSDLRIAAFRGLFGGVLDIDLQRAGAFNGDLEWHLVDVGSLWQSYGLAYAEKRRGALSGRLTFRGDRPEARALKGTGTLALRRGRFFSPLSFRVLGVLKIPVEAESMIHRADVAFSFERELVYIEKAKLRAQSYLLEGAGLVGFGGGVNLEIAHAGTTVAVSGSLSDPAVKVLPLNGLTAPFHRMFRERVR